MSNARSPGISGSVSCAITGLGLVVLGAGLAVGGGDAFGSRPWRVTPVSLAASMTLGATVLLVLGGLRGTTSHPPAPVSVSSSRTDRWLWLAPVVAVAGGLAVHLLPRWFDSVAREDGVVEWISALAAASACVFVASAARRHEGSVRWVMALAAVGLLVMAGEELSWFQRLLDYGTPAGLEANAQGEANLHNLATDRFQSAYYLGASVGLVLLPYAHRWSPRSLAQLGHLVPGRVPLALAAASVAFTYARTGNVVHHVTFWIALSVLVSWDQDGAHPWAIALGAAIVAGQTLVFAGGSELERPWAPAEYRETLTALALAAWAAEVRRRSAPVDHRVVAATEAGRNT